MCAGKRTHPYLWTAVNQAVISAVQVYTVQAFACLLGVLKPSPSSVEDICVQELNCESWLLYWELYVEVSIQL